MVKTETAKQWAGGVVRLAEIFEVTHGAVSQWGEFLPPQRVYELRIKRPAWFHGNGNIRPFRARVQ